MVLTGRLKHQNHLGVLIFGKKVYLEIEVISLLGLNAASILAHEDEEREKNGSLEEIVGGIGFGQLAK